MQVFTLGSCVCMFSALLCVSVHVEAASCQHKDRPMHVMSVPKQVSNRTTCYYYFTGSGPYLTTLSRAKSGS